VSSASLVTALRVSTTFELNDIGKSGNEHINATSSKHFSYCSPVTAFFAFQGVLFPCQCTAVTEQSLVHGYYFWERNISAECICFSHFLIVVLLWYDGREALFLHFSKQHFSEFIRLVLVFSPSFSRC